MTHIYNELSHKKKQELFVVRWMDLESVIQSEVSQKEKNKGFPGGAVVKNLPASAGVRALVWEDPTCRGATKPMSHNY